MQIRVIASNLKILYEQTRVYWKYLLLALVGTLLASLSEASIYRFVVPVVLNEGIAGQTGSGLNIPLFANDGIANQNAGDLRMPLLILGVFLTRGLGEFVAKYFMGYVGRNSVRTNRSRLLNHMLTLPVAFFTNSLSGSLISKINYETEMVATAITDSVLELSKDIFMVLFLLISMFTISWQMTLASLLLFPVIALHFTMVGSRVRRYSAKVQESIGDLTNVASIVVSAHATIKSLSGQNRERKRIARASSNNCRLEMKIILIKALSDPIMQAIAALALASLVYQASFQTRLNAGLLVAFFGSMFALIRPLKRITEVNNVINRGVVALESINKLLHEPSEIDSGDIENIEKPKIVSFNNISFSYPGREKRVLNNISFSARRGNMVALVGKSGAGKSTILSLLQRLYNLKNGSIKFDDKNIQDLKLSCLRSQIAVVPQKIWLFNDTIANNVSYGIENVSEQAIEDALKKSGAWDFISTHAEGIHRVVGENGDAISGGQQQRLAIARALLRNAPIILLDEATSSLDTQSESYVQGTLELLKENSILIVIAHRLSTIKLADNILVLEQGSIVESGTHESLLNDNCSYASLYSKSAVG